MGISVNGIADRVTKLPRHFLYLLLRYPSQTSCHAANYLCVENGKKSGIAVMVTSFMVLILQWVNTHCRIVLSVGEMPATFGHTDIFLAMTTKQSVRHVILH